MSEVQTTAEGALPSDFQERLFKIIAKQRPAAVGYIKELRRQNPDATPAEIARKIEKWYVTATTSASAAAGATATIPVVGIPTAVALGVADLTFFYESTALFAICMAELRGYRIDDEERAKVVVLGAMLGEKRKSKITDLVMTALPAGASFQGARKATEKTVSAVAPKWGDLLSQQLPDSALVPVSMVLAKEALARGAVMGSARVGSKALPVIGAFVGGATSYWFGSGVVKSCREGFSAPAAEWPEWLDVGDEPAVTTRVAAAAIEAAKKGSDVVAGAAKKGSTVVAGAAKKGSGVVADAAKKGSGAVAGGAKKLGSAAKDAAGTVAAKVKKTDPTD